MRRSVSTAGPASVQRRVGHADRKGADGSAVAHCALADASIGENHELDFSVAGGRQLASAASTIQGGKRVPTGPRLPGPTSASRTRRLRRRPRPAPVNGVAQSIEVCHEG